MSDQTDSKRTMRIAALLQTGGQHMAAWRHPDAEAGSGMDFEFYKRLVKTAERGKFDFAFLTDVQGVRNWPVDLISRSAQTSLQIEPLTLMSALSSITQNIGFVITASSTYAYPYTVARQFAGLDLISGGRVGWNIVTSVQPTEAKNYGLKNPLDHSLRYERANEFVAAVRGLWASIEPGVFLGDKSSGLLFDKDKIHPFVFEGKHVGVDGILNVPPSAQGRPVLVQAGASGPGRDLAASVAEVIFAASPEIAISQEFYRDLKSRMQRLGRGDNSCRILTGIVPIIGKTEEEAGAKLAELDALIHPDIGLACLGDYLGGVDLSPYPIDGPLPADLPVSNNSRTLFDQILGVANKEKMSIRRIAARVAAGITHQMVIGTPMQVADIMEEWFTNEACDGFLVSGSLFPRDLDDFVDLVIPELQRRGLFRSEYEATTLRGNLGLSPSS